MMIRTFMSFLSVLTLSVWLTAGCAAAAGTNAQISDIEFGYDPSRGLTRVVIHASDNLDYRSSAYGDDGRGIRYVLDFPPLKWAFPNNSASKGEGVGNGEIYRYRYAQHDEFSRLVFDLDRPLVVVGASSVPPAYRGDSWRLIIDFQASNAETFNALRPNALEAQPSAADGAAVAPHGVTPPVAPPSLPTIVIDAGHGGKDPGTLGRKGAYEKDIVLEAAIKLRDLLMASNRYKVIMTRETDVFIEHDERVRIARTADADLFISLHADAAGNRQVQGASVYTLSEKGEARLDTKLKDPSWGVPLEVDAAFEDDELNAEVETILVDLTKRETQNNSSEFAEILIPELAKAGPVLRNTHRKANYYVLLSPNVPAVLLEMGFLSNASDEQRLKSDRGIDKSMVAVKHAIDVYFDKQKQKYDRYGS